MTEKKLLVDGLRYSYSGPFDITDFFGFIEDWMHKNNLHKETKRKIEYVEETGKKVEWTIEAWKMLEQEAKSVTRMRALFNNVKDIEIQRGGASRSMNHGEVLIIIDAFLESHFHHTWWSYKPIAYFLRAIVDKYIYKFWSEKYDEEIRNTSFDLHKQIGKFFNRYKY